MTLAEVSRRVQAVAIGASAGGIEALSVLLPALRPGAQVSVLVVVHLPRGGTSLLPEIFRGRTPLSVAEASDKEVISPGTVYFAPPDYHLLVDQGPQLALSVDEPEHHSRPSIDVLFESAAELYQDRLLGVALSGASQDGARGLEAIGRAGGITAVQDPATAHARVLPESALLRWKPDFVQSLEQLSALFAALV